MPTDPSSLQPRALCSLVDVLKRVPGYEIGDSVETEEILNDLIVQESRDFVEATQREIVAMNADTSRQFDVTSGVVERRVLWIGDVASISAITIKLHDGTLVQTLDSSAYIAEPRLRDSWQPITSLRFPVWTNSPAILWADTVCELTGSFGFPAIPDTVKRAVATLVLVRYLNDVAAAGTQIAELAIQHDLSLAAALRAALDTRDRLRAFP